MPGHMKPHLGLICAHNKQRQGSCASCSYSCICRALLALCGIELSTFSACLHLSLILHVKE